MHRASGLFPNTPRERIAADARQPATPGPQSSCAVPVRTFFPLDAIPLLIALIAMAGHAGAAGLSGRVVGITDGDNLTVLVDRREVKVRLAEIDAPELQQPFGERSRESLAELCNNRPAVVNITGKSRTGGTVGWVTCGIRDASEHQVRTGMAWVNDVYAKDAGLYALQDDAKVRRQGLWSDPKPMPPWAWRSANRKKAPAR